MVASPAPSVPTFRQSDREPLLGCFGCQRTATQISRLEVVGQGYTSYAAHCARCGQGLPLIWRLA